MSALAEAAIIPDGSLEALKDSLEPTFAESSSENAEALAYFREENTLLRYLRSRNFDVRAAAEACKHSFKWRCERRPDKIFCSFCTEDKHSHNMRCVGFDAEGSPVIYTCFEGATRRWNVTANMEHTTRLLEDCQKLINQRRRATGQVRERYAVTPKEEQWCLMVDFQGFGISDCDPRTGVHCAHLLAHYPERLKSAVIVDAPFGWNFLWGAIRPILDTRTSSKVHFVRSTDNQEAWNSLGLGNEAIEWLRAEIAENRDKRITIDKKYWMEPTTSDNKHNPRGFPSFLKSAYFDITLEWEREAEKKLSPTDAVDDK
jgi:hypothetical protein